MNVASASPLRGRRSLYVEISRLFPWCGVLISTAAYLAPAAFLPIASWTTWLLGRAIVRFRRVDLPDAGTRGRRAEFGAYHHSRAELLLSLGCTARRAVLRLAQSFRLAAGGLLVGAANRNGFEQNASRQFTVGIMGIPLWRLMP